jgi:hypothetical protein
MPRAKQQDSVAGLGAEVELPKMIPALQPADLAHGVVARYLSSEDRKSKGFDRAQKMHTLQLSSTFGGAKFALWGATQLDLKLRAVPPTSIVVLTYQGREQRERAPHLWSVRPFRGTSQDLSTLQEEYAAGCQSVADAIAALEARTGGADFAEDDLPF